MTRTLTPTTTAEAVDLLTPTEREAIARAWIAAPEREWFHLPTHADGLPAALRDLTSPDHAPLPWVAEDPAASGRHARDGDRRPLDYVDALGWLLAVAEAQRLTLHGWTGAPTLAGWAIHTARLRSRLPGGGVPAEVRGIAQAWAREVIDHYADGGDDDDPRGEAGQWVRDHAPGYGYGAWEHGYLQACDGCGQPCHHEAGWWLPTDAEAWWDEDHLPTVCLGCGTPAVHSA